MKDEGFKKGPVIPAGQGGRLLRLVVSVWGYSSMLCSFVVAWWLLVRAGEKERGGKGGIREEQTLGRHLNYCSERPERELLS